MGKTIQEQIAEMENRSKKLEEIHKLFLKMVKSEFGVEAKDIHKNLENNDAKPTAFEKKIIGYFGIKSDQDKDNFIRAFCNDDGFNHFKKITGKPDDSATKNSLNKVSATTPILSSLSDKKTL